MVWLAEYPTVFHLQLSFRIFQIGEISSTAYSSVANRWHFGKMLQQVAQIKDSYWYTSNPAPIRKRKVNLSKRWDFYSSWHLNCKNFRLAAKHQRPFKVWSLVTTSLVLWFCRVFWELSRNGFDHGGWGYDLVQVTVTGRCKVPPGIPKTFRWLSDWFLSRQIPNHLDETKISSDDLRYQGKIYFWDAKIPTWMGENARSGMIIDNYSRMDGENAR